MNFYLVFDHYYSGIIQSQVIDVVESLENETNEKFTIIAFVNLRRFIDARAKYKAHAQRVVVLPNFGFSRWHWSIIFLVPVALLKKPRITIGRSVFANQLALILRKYRLTKEVVLDARGAEFAEWSEYFFKENEGPIANLELKRLEKESVEQSDRLLAVSKKLINYWCDSLDATFDRNRAMVIPSSLSIHFAKDQIDNAVRLKLRNTLSVSMNEVLLVFSGSDSDWHAFFDVLSFCTRLALKQDNIRFLFLTNAKVDFEKHPSLSGKLILKWLSQKQVFEYLQAADYGLLLRNNSITNHVSSPVKFAEYLASGLKVIVSDNIGDFSEFVEEHNTGIIVRDWNENLNLEVVSEVERQRISSIGKSMFSKSQVSKDLKKVFFDQIPISN